jgi:Ca-activated chloride channel family protein
MIGPEPYSDGWLGALWSSDAELDERLRSVPTPIGLLPRLERIARRHQSLERVQRMALAASLLIALGLICGASLFVLWVRSGESRGLVLPEIADDAGPQGGGGKVDPRLELDPRKLGRLPAHSLAGGPPPAPEIRLQEVRPEIDLTSKWRLDRILRPDGGSDPFLDGSYQRWPVLGSPHRPFDELPELSKVPPPTPQGIRVPLAPGFDLPFFIRAGVHPFLIPVDPRLQSMLVPLGIGKASYELTRRYVSDGELPPPEAIRVEEFLAAVDYGFPTPVATPVGLYLAAGPSPFGGEGLRAIHGGEALRLVQFGVQARQQTRAKRVPVSLVLAVDTSASMAWGGRLEMVCRALKGVVGQLEPADRLALVSFSERAEVLAAEVRREHAEQFRAALERLKPAGWTNVGAALRQAYAVAPPAPKGAVRAVVLLSDGLAELDPNSKTLIQQRLAEAAAGGLHLEIIDLRQEADDLSLASQLEDLARSGRGSVRRATDADQVGWALSEIITGKSQLVARDVRLQVTFLPAAVLQYRLLGHEAAKVAGLLPARAEVDFYSGQSATGLCEVWLRPKGGDEVGKVELSWLDPGATQRRTISKKLSRGMFAGSVPLSPPPLLAAAVVAEVAELLRESPFARQGPNFGNLARPMELAGLIDTRIRSQPAFAEFVAMVRAAQKAKPYSRTVRR